MWTRNTFRIFEQNSKDGGKRSGCKAPMSGPRRCCKPCAAPSEMLRAVCHAPLHQSWATDWWDSHDSSHWELWLTSFNLPPFPPTSNQLRVCGLCRPRVNVLIVFGNTRGQFKIESFPQLFHAWSVCTLEHKPENVIKANNEKDPANENKE